MFILKFFLIAFIAFILFILIVAVSLALHFRNIIKVFINGNRHAKTQTTSDSPDSNDTYTSQSTSRSTSETHSGRIFAPDEGEYVDFEEVP